MPITGLSHTIASSGQSPPREKGRQNLNNKELVITPEGLKALEDENRRLKRMFADLSMQADLLKEALGKK